MNEDDTQAAWNHQQELEAQRWEEEMDEIQKTLSSDPGYHLWLKNLDRSWKLEDVKGYQSWLDQLEHRLLLEYPDPFNLDQQIDNG